MLSAALDIIGPDLPAAIVLLANILPSFFVQSTAPWFMGRIPYIVRVAAIVLMGIASFLFPAFGGPLWVKLVGVVFASLSSGFGEITWLSYSAHFHKDVVSAFSSGTGGAGIFGSISYLGLRYIFSSKETLMYSSPIPLGMALCYFFMMQPDHPITHDIQEEETEKEDLLTGTEPSKLTPRQKMQLFVKLLPYMIPLAAVYYGEYLINQGVSPVLVYPDSLVAGDEYKYYQAIYQIGVFISRSSVNIFPLKRLYFPSFLQIVNAIFLSFVAVFDFVPTIWIIFAIIFWEGLLGGAIYVNAFYLISQHFDGIEKEFCMGAASMSYAGSITLAALSGIVWEPLLLNWRKKVA